MLKKSRRSLKRKPSASLLSQDLHKRLPLSSQNFLVSFAIVLKNLSNFFCYTVQKPLPYSVVSKTIKKQMEGQMYNFLTSDP